MSSFKQQIRNNLESQINFCLTPLPLVGFLRNGLGYKRTLVKLKCQENVSQPVAGPTVGLRGPYTFGIIFVMLIGAIAFPFALGI